MQKLFFTVFIYTLLGISTGFSQTVTIDEGFDDGDFTNNPTWNDPEGKHIVNGSNRLQLNAPGVTDEAVISTPSNAAYGEWEAFIQLGFNPSGGNLAKFYILSDTQSMKGNVNGYFILIGDTEDEVSLYRQDGNSDTKIIDGTDDLIDNSPVTLRVRITRDLDGNWELFADPAGGTSYTSQGTVTDNTYGTSNFIGFFSDYTSTRNDLFEYDDIKVTKVNPPLDIQDVILQDNSTIDVKFNLDIKQSSVSSSDFSINNSIGSPGNSPTFPSSNVVRLSYNSALPSNKYNLTVNNIDDTDGNTIAANTTTSFTLFGTFSTGDVIINEFLKDPPSDQSEYVELKNHSGKYLNLQDWEIGEGSGNVTISSDQVVLEPNGFIVVSADTSSLYDVYGSRHYIETSLGALNNGTDDIIVNTNNGTRVDSLRYNDNWGGVKVAIERRSDTAPSIYKENFGDSPNALGGTPGLANEVADDTTPPNLDNLIITDNQTIDLDFSERLDQTNATNASNYSLDNGITINSATQTASDSVRLSLSGALQNGTTYQLTITNQQDIFGNAAGTINKSFNYYVVSAPDSGDIFINEFTYDPPSGSTEYVELYNPTSKSLDLNGWTLNDNTGNRKVITNTRFVIPPDSFAVLAPDNTLLTDYPNINLVNVGSNFPQLNNTGEEDIVIRDSTGVLLDSLQYTSDWGGSSVALERRTVDASAFKANFGDSPNGFGTPGSQNEVTADTTPPDLTAFSILNDQSLEFVFNEKLNSSSATSTSNYSISGTPNIIGATLSGGNTVRISLSGPLQNNTKYTATINGVKDRFGNAIANRDTSFTYYKTSPADSGDVFINEFTYDPPEGSTEYIELYNPTSKSFDLNGWTINDNTGNQKTITSSQFVIPPDSFAVLAPDETLLNDYPGINLLTLNNRFPSLNNSGDDIVIRRADGTRLDSLTYTSAFGGNSKATERRSTTAPPIQSNFGDAPNGFGTPGSANGIQADTTPPDLSSIIIRGRQTLDLNFTEPLNKTEAKNAGNYAIDHGINVTQVQQTANDSVRVNLDSPLQNGITYMLSVSNQKDIFGNTAATIDTTFQVTADTAGPLLDTFTIPDNQTLKLAFSESIKNGPAANIGNYSLNHGINISGATQTAGDSVSLQLDAPLKNAVSYQLIIQNQQDTFDNTTTSIDTTFTYYITSGADSGDVFINEFTYDPPTGSTEYVELYNTSSKSIDLNGWTINDNTGKPNVITSSRFVIPPDSFAVLAPDNTLLTDYQSINLLTLGSRFPSLNNSGDDIVIRRSDGIRLDSLTYTTAFGGDNKATERRTTQAPPIQSNFGDAPNGFGTPGSANQIQPDNQPPLVNSAHVLDNTTIQLIFSEAITAGTATNQSNYSISPSRDIQIISSVQDTVTLLLSQELQSEQPYQLAIQNLQDVFGNAVIDTTLNIRFVAFSPPQSRDIVINEFLPTSPEFIELFNTTDENFDLSNWVIGDASNTVTIQTGTLLGPGEYIVFSEQSLQTNIKQNTTSVVLSDLPSLDNDEDVIYIRTDAGVTVDSLSYSPAFGGSIDGKSAERIDPGGASNDASNFTTSTAEGGSSPGTQNAVFQIDQSSPAIVFSRIFPNGDIEVRFSEFISLTPDVNFLLGDQTLTVDSFDPSNGSVIFLNTPAGTATESDLTVTAQNLSDVKGNVTASTQLAVSQPLTPGDVVINEILFDPLSDSDDNQPDQSEYIELRNTRDYAINLENITLHDAPDENGEVRTLTPVSTTSKYIPAQGTALIYAEDATSVFGQSKVAQFFDIQNSTSNSVIRIDRSSLSLASSDDAIYLAGGNDATIDSVFYDENWHNPNLVDTDGIALERINPLGPSNNDSNWGSSTAETGGTPNQENTLFEAPQQGGQQEIGISFSANPFSPDGDGIDENLLINYKLDQPDFLITVRIYDRYGRLVRELADGQQAGLQGSLIWDGLKDNGDHNRIGIYIVIFKAFDSANGNNKAFKKTVVLARRLN